MEHKEKRNRMDVALKAIVVPFLRSKNFKGTFPHFRRENRKDLNLLTFQFSNYKAKFVVEISNCPSAGMTTYSGKELSPSACRVSFMENRLRVGSIKHSSDYWYDFDKQILLGDIFTKRAKEIVSNWEEAEIWWRENPHEPESK